VFRRDLLQLVSDRTGYPIDMLDETLPLEAGLGIDSIKTVEIFSKLKEYHVYFREASRGQSEEETLAAFTKLKTLRDVIDAYDQVRRTYLGQIVAPPAAAEKPDIVERYRVTAVAAPEERGGVKKNSLTDASSSSWGTAG
jgi:hypothetical protein